MTGSLSPGVSGIVANDEVFVLRDLTYVLGNARSKSNALPNPAEFAASNFADVDALFINLGYSWPEDNARIYGRVW